MSKRHRGQPLLAVDHEQRRLARHRVQPLLDVDDGADEVGRDRVVAAGAQDVVPELPALPLAPAVGALVDRDDELRRLLEELEQLGFGGLHTAISPLIRRGSSRSRAARSFSFCALQDSNLLQELVRRVREQSVKQVRSAEQDLQLLEQFSRLSCWIDVPTALDRQFSELRSCSSGTGNRLESRVAWPRIDDESSGSCTTVFPDRAETDRCPACRHQDMRCRATRASRPF